MGNFIKRFFVEDYVYELEKIDKEITESMKGIVQYRRYKRSFIQYTLILTMLLWLIYMGYWKWFMTPVTSKVKTISVYALFAVIPLSGAIISYIWSYIFQIFIDYRENRIEELRVQHNEKLEAFKKKLDWEKTTFLIDKYEKKSNLSPMQPFKNGPLKPGTPNQTKLKQGNIDSPIKHNVDKPEIKPEDIKKDTSSISNAPVDAKEVVSSGFFDRLLDYVIGDSPSNSYALICEKCHANNGLIPLEEKDNAQYYCKKCDHHNVSKKNKEKMDNSLKDQGSNEVEGKREKSKHNENKNEEIVLEEDLDEEVNVKPSEKEKHVTIQRRVRAAKD